jgi:hypothetical protein
MDRRTDISRLIVAFHNCFENVHNETKIKYSNTVFTLTESILLMPPPIRFKDNLVISYSLGHQGIFPSPKHQESTCGLNKCVPGAICPEVTWPEADVGHSVLSNLVSKLRMHGNTPPLMHTPSWRT